MRVKIFFHLDINFNLEVGIKYFNVSLNRTCIKPINYYAVYVKLTIFLNLWLLWKTYFIKRSFKYLQVFCIKICLDDVFIIIHLQSIRRPKKILIIGWIPLSPVIIKYIILRSFQNICYIIRDVRLLYY